MSDKVDKLFEFVNVNDKLYILYIYIKGVLNSPFILSNNIHEKAEV